MFLLFYPTTLSLTVLIKSVLPVPLERHSDRNLDSLLGILPRSVRFPISSSESVFLTLSPRLTPSPCSDFSNSLSSGYTCVISPFPPFVISTSTPLSLVYRETHFDSRRFHRPWSTHRTHGPPEIVVKPDSPSQDRPECSGKERL